MVSILSIKFKTPVLRSDLCDYSDVYIVGKWAINLLVSIGNEHDNGQKMSCLKTRLKLLHTCQKSTTHL